MIQIFIETMKLIIIALLLLSYLTVLSEGKATNKRVTRHVTSVVKAKAKTDPDDEYDYEYEEPTVIEKKDPCKVTSKNIG